MSYFQEVKGERTEVEQDTADDCELDGLLGFDLAGLFCSVLSVFRVSYEVGVVVRKKWGLLQKAENAQDLLRGCGWMTEMYLDLLLG